MTNAKLRIGGLTPLTTIDFPEKLAAVVFCQGCPWRCYYCHNTSLQPPQGETEIDWEDILTFLSSRQRLLDAVVFSGGEPTAQPSLLNALAEIKAMGFLTGLHSAGIYPQRLEKAIAMLDWIGLDIKALPEQYVSITTRANSGEAAWQSAEIVLRHNLPHQFRIPLADGLTEQQLQTIEERLRSMGAKHIVRTPLLPAPL